MGLCKKKSGKDWKGHSVMRILTWETGAFFWRAGLLFLSRFAVRFIPNLQRFMRIYRGIWEILS